MTLRPLVLLALFLMGCSPAVAPSATPTPKMPTPTRVEPTAVPSTPTSPGPGEECLEWKDVDRSLAGRNVCIFGDVLLGFTAKDGNGNIVLWAFRFSEDVSAFYFTQEHLPFEFQAGDCISTTGLLRLDDQDVPVMMNGKIARC